ncbi:MAG: hypothetical protein AB1631_17550 [Acidobacteriota bacterium]
MAKWKKLGLIIKPIGRHDWMVSHGMLPIAEWRHDDVYRIYFSGRDAQNRSLTGYAEIDLNHPCDVLRYSEKPVLGLGALGCFDDNGVTPSWIIDHAGRKYLYYIGWNKGATVRMHLVAGLSVSDDGGESFQRVLRVPILDRTDQEPYTLNTAPCVMVEGDLWRMWYVSGVEWVHPDLPRYNIKYAESMDGRHWNRPGIVCIDFASPHENALARPCVRKENGTYKMWFSYKGESYRIGYAESEDGIRWERLDRQAGIDVSDSGWDSEMIEYAYVFEHKGTKYMLYNGNDYGRAGIGLAIAEQMK